MDEKKLDGFQKDPTILSADIFFSNITVPVRQLTSQPPLAFASTDF